MTAKPWCVRCINPKAATDTLYVCLDDEPRVRIDVCREHWHRARADILGWINGAEIAGNGQHQPPITFGQKSENRTIPFPIRRTGIVINHDAEEIPPWRAGDPLGAIEIPKGTSLPPSAREWAFTEHAVSRVIEREINPVSALLAAVSPIRTKAGSQPGTVVHNRGAVSVVVVPEQKVVITAYSENYATDPRYRPVAQQQQA